MLATVPVALAEPARFEAQLERLGVSAATTSSAAGRAKMPNLARAKNEDSAPLLSVFGTCQKEAEAPKGKVVELLDTGWRTEIIGNGKYYTWRKGSHGNRQSARGGTFTPEGFGTGYKDRFEEYQKNKAAREDRRAADVDA